MKILVIQTAFIGDVILATPVLTAIHNHHPDFTIDVLVRKGNEILLSGFPGIRKVITWDKKNNKSKNLYTLIKNIRKEKYDEVINLQRFFSTGLLTAFSGAKIKTGFDKNPLSFYFNNKVKHEIGNGKLLHEVERNLLLVKHLGGDLFIRPSLFPSKANFEKVENLKSIPYICIAPASVWFTKQMPEERWLKLIELLPLKYASGLNIYILGAPDESEKCESIKEKSNSLNVFNLSGKLSLMETAALMKDAKMNYVNDSAPMHIASAMNAPVTAFFCSTIPAFGFGPLSDVSKILEIEGKLYCRPCGLHGFKSCPEKHFRCGYEIPVEKAVQSFE